MKEIYRHYSCTEYGDKEYNLEAEMPCPEGTLQEEVGCLLNLAGSCRTWRIEIIIYVVRNIGFGFYICSAVTQDS